MEMEPGRKARDRGQEEEEVRDEEAVGDVQNGRKSFGCRTNGPMRLSRLRD